MPTAKEIEPGIEINGIFVDIFLEAFKLFPSVVLKRLVAFGIGSLQGREVIVDRQAWYPLDSWLAAHDDILKSIGPRASFSIGQQIPKIAVPPPTITDIHGILGGLNVMYHSYHRKRGKIMADMATGTLLSGIGNYGYQPEGKQRIVSVCDTPYPCDLDRGLITGMAQRFERFARVSHDERSCRKQGAPSCTYVVAW
jgi:hypothetical protein